MKVDSDSFRFSSLPEELRAKVVDHLLAAGDALSARNLGQVDRATRNTVTTRFVPNSRSFETLWTLPNPPVTNRDVYLAKKAVYQLTSDARPFALSHLLSRLPDAVRQAAVSTPNIPNANGRKDGRGLPPLLLCASRMDMHTAQVLVSHGADVMGEDAYGKTALQYARHAYCSEGGVFPPRSPHAFETFCFISWLRGVATMRAFLHTVDPRPSLEEAVAAGDGLWVAVQAAGRSSFDDAFIDSVRASPAKHGVARLLLQHAAPEALTPKQRQTLARMKFNILGRGKKPPGTALMFAAARGDTAEVMRLVCKGAAIAGCDQQSRRAWQHAVMGGHVNLGRILLGLCFTLKPEQALAYDQAMVPLTFNRAVRHGHPFFASRFVPESPVDAAFIREALREAPAEMLDVILAADANAHRFVEEAITASLAERRLKRESLRRALPYIDQGKVLRASIAAQNKDVQEFLESAIAESRAGITSVERSEGA